MALDVTPGAATGQYPRPQASVDPDRTLGWLRRILPVVAVQRWQFIGSVAAGLIGMVATVSVPIMLGRGIDALAAGDTPTPFVIALFILALVSVRVWVCVPVRAFPIRRCGSRTPQPDVRAAHRIVVRLLGSNPEWAGDQPSEHRHSVDPVALCLWAARGDADRAVRFRCHRHADRRRNAHARRHRSPALRLSGRCAATKPDFPAAVGGDRSPGRHGDHR